MGLILILFPCVYFWDFLIFQILEKDFLNNQYVFGTTTNGGIPIKLWTLLSTSIMLIVVYSNKARVTLARMLKKQTTCFTFRRQRVSVGHS